MKLVTDFVVIGSGIAGLNSALTLCAYGKVLVITKKKIADAATAFAQGGIAAVTNRKDSNVLHEQDTIKAGAFHNDKTAVQFLVRQGKSAIDQLIQVGVSFDKKATLEAAHSFPRILHATDFTGQEIEIALIQAIKKNTAITIWEHAMAFDLIVKNNQCFGVQVIKDRKIVPISSRAVVLATGGIGQVYAWTTNPSVATGDGIAIADRVGAKLADLEFIQFHPTALLARGQSSFGRKEYFPLFLLSEAMRGEGAYLVDANGNRFIDELSPRDVVARAIFQKQHEGTVYLDIRHKGKVFLKKRFPNIYKELRKKGVDLSKDIIPITPAEHFICGGITTDLYGQTSIKNLFAFGEVASTGVHGANRLASNSLLEGMVFSSQIKHSIKNLPEKITQIKTDMLLYQEKSPKNTLRIQVREIMWKYVGIERSQIGLRIAIKKLKKLEQKIDELTKRGVNEELLETKNIIQTALLITKAALKRKTSLGAHYLTP